MITYLKFGFQILKFSLGIKLNCVMIAFFTALGVIFEFAYEGENITGMFMILLLTMWPIQMIYSVSMSNEVATSPYKKALQTKVPAVMNLVVNYLVFTGIVLIKLAEYYWIPGFKGDVCNMIFLLGLISIAFNVYSAFVYKFYCTSIIMFIIMYSFFFSVIIRNYIIKLGSQWPLPVVILCAYGFVTIGVILQYVCSLLIYRYPLSKRAQGIMYKKYF